MPCCVLRVTGNELDLDECLGSGEFEPDNVYRKGEPRVKQRPGGPVNDHNGFTIMVSDSGGDRVSLQIGDARRFLEGNKSKLRDLTAREDVEAVYLDFGWDFPVGENVAFAQFNHFPPELLRLCGELNIGIEVSVYASEDTDD